MRSKLEMAAREVAKTTTFSATQAAEAYFFLASAGLDAAQSIEALPRVAKFAQAGNFDLARATDLLTDAQSALGLTIRDDVVKNMENMARADIAGGLVNKPLKIDHHMSFFDTATCQTFTEVIVTNPEEPYVLAARLRVNHDKIAELEILWTTTGYWLFNADNYLRYSSAEDWGPIPAERRDSRETLLFAANAYLDAFLERKIDLVPWGFPCVRIEGGAYTANYVTFIQSMPIVLAGQLLARPEVAVSKVDIPQYRLPAIVGVWAAAALPMAALAWLVAPAVADRLSGEGNVPLGKALLISVTVGLIWQFVLVVALVGREQRTLRWSTVREALWLRSPRSPRSGRRGGRIWLVVIPLMAAYAAVPFVVPRLSASAREPFTDVATTLLPFAATIACFYAARQHTRRLRRAWLLLGASSLSWTFGNAIWIFYERALRIEVPFPSWALEVLRFAVNNQHLSEIALQGLAYDPPAALGKGLVDELAGRDRPLERRADPALAAGDAGAVGLDHDDVEAGPRADLRDAGAHQSASHHTHTIQLHHVSRGGLRSRNTQLKLDGCLVNAVTSA